MPNNIISQQCPYLLALARLSMPKCVWKYRATKYPEIVRHGMHSPTPFRPELDARQANCMIEALLMLHFEVKYTGDSWYVELPCGASKEGENFVKVMHNAGLLYFQLETEKKK